MSKRAVPQQWIEEVLPGDAWRRLDSGWDVASTLELLASLSPDLSSGERGLALMHRIVPPESLREVAVICVDERGSLARPADVSVGTDLLAWVVECVWCTTSGLSILREGHAIVRLRAEGAGFIAHLCLPLRPMHRQQTLIACDLRAVSHAEALRRASRLTLLASILPPVSVSDTTEAGSPESPSPCPETLSARQRAILAGMAEGLTNRQIAARICFSESTVRLESMAIYRYFAVHSRAQAVTAARDAGLLLDEALSVSA